VAPGGAGYGVRQAKDASDLVMQLARGPLGVPVAITDPSASLGRVLADARQVQNRLPDGAAWDGRTELPMDEETLSGYSPSSVQQPS
jgi:hypothetical protein